MAQQEATIPQMQALEEGLKDTTLFEVAHDSGGGKFVSRRVTAAQIAAHAAGAAGGLASMSRGLKRSDSIAVGQDQGNGVFAPRKTTVGDLGDFAGVAGAGRLVPFLSDLSRSQNECAGLPTYSSKTLTGITSLVFDRLIASAGGGISLFGCPDLESMEFPVLEQVKELSVHNCPRLTLVSLPRLEILGTSGLRGGGVLTLRQNPELVFIELPALRSVGEQAEISMEQNAKLTRFSAPLLMSGDLSWDDHPALTEVVLPMLSSGGVSITGAALRVLSLPQLTTGMVSISSEQLERLELPVLSEGDLYCYGPSGLTSVELPEYTTVSWGLEMKDHAALTNVWMPKLANAGFLVDISGCALTAESVNHILARLAADPHFGFDPGTGMAMEANLSGGTNASPTGQGLIDKATLIARGATITTN